MHRLPMKTLIQLIVSGLLLGSILGCESVSDAIINPPSPEEQGKLKDSYFQSDLLQVGMTQSEAEEAFGKPQFDRIKTIDGDTHDTWHYRYSRESIYVEGPEEVVMQQYRDPQTGTLMRLPVSRPTRILVKQFEMTRLLFVNDSLTEWEQWIEDQYGNLIRK